MGNILDCCRGNNSGEDYKLKDDNSAKSTCK